MTILMLNTLYYPTQVGGAERSVQILAEDLVQMRHKVVVACLNNKNDNFFTHNGVKVYTFKNKNIYWPFDYKKPTNIKKVLWHLIDTYLNLQEHQINKLIKIEKPDLVLINNISGFTVNILKTIRNHKIPIVQTIRDYYYLCIKSTCFNNSNCSQLCKSCKLTSRHKLHHLNQYADCIVGISDFVIRKHQKHALDLKKPTVKIYNAAKKYSTEKLSCFKKGKNISFGYIGKITEEKGVEKMLSLMEQVRLQGYNFGIKLAGEGDSKYIDSLILRFPNLNLNFLGFQKPSFFYSSIHALIVPSLWNEPFGRVVIEGAYNDLPIFVSNNGALLELRKKLKGVKEFDMTSVCNFIKSPESFEFTYDLSEFSSAIISKQYENLFLKLLTNEN